MGMNMELRHELWPPRRGWDSLYLNRPEAVRWITNTPSIDSPDTRSVHVYRHLLSLRQRDPRFTSMYHRDFERSLQSLIATRNATSAWSEGSRIVRDCRGSFPLFSSFTSLLFLQFADTLRERGRLPEAGLTRATIVARRDACVVEETWPRCAAVQLELKRRERTAIRDTLRAYYFPRRRSTRLCTGPTFTNRSPRALGVRCRWKSTFRYTRHRQILQPSRVSRRRSPAAKMLSLCCVTGDPFSSLSLYRY